MRRFKGVLSLVAGAAGCTARLYSPARRALRLDRLGMTRQVAVRRRNSAKGASMAKGYWVARVDVSDPDAYRKYIEANAEAFRAYGGRFIVRGGRFECKEGAARQRNVVIEFDSYEQALACYESAGYAYAKSLRAAHAVSDLVIIEGYDGPQP